MGKCQQTMNRKRKTLQQQRKENGRSLRLRRDPVGKNKADAKRVSGQTRTGKGARKQLRNARRAEANKESDKKAEESGVKGANGKGGDVEMAA